MRQLLCTQVTSGQSECERQTSCLPEELRHPVGFRTGSLMRHSGRGSQNLSGTSGQYISDILTFRGAGPKTKPMASVSGYKYPMPISIGQVYSVKHTKP